MLSPVDWMTKCRAPAGGFASSEAGTCASTDVTAKVNPASTSHRRICRSSEVRRTIFYRFDLMITPTLVVALRELER